MIEKVARRLCIEAHGDDLSWELHVPAAIAAIKAMQHPSTGMAEMGFMLVGQRYHDVWHGMINAALGEHS